MMPPTSIDGTDITGATIDGTDVQEITVDGQTVFTAVPAGAFDVDQMTFSSNGLSGQTAWDVTFNNVGDVVFTTEGSNLVEAYSLGTPFDITTIGASPIQTKSPETGITRSTRFNDDGTRFYESDSTAGKVHQVNLATPFDVTTKSSVNTINSNGTGVRGVEFNDDGTKYYEVDDSNGIIVEFNLATPYDITTKSSSVAQKNEEGRALGMAFNNDGSRLYETDINSDVVFQFDLPTPFDISTTTNKTSISVFGSNNPSGIDFNTNGSKMFVSTQPDGIGEYSV